MIKITIDPGHGQYGNPYPPQKGFYEGTQMWKLANFLKPELEKYGFEVTTTRPKLTNNPSLSSRGKMAAGHDLIVCLHSNAPARRDDTKPTGSVVYRTIETPEIKPLADNIGKKVSDLMGHHFRGTMVKESGSRPGKNYNGVLRSAMAAGVKAGMLIEHGFHTNLKDSAFLIKDENLKKLAVAEAGIIAEYYNQKEKGEADESMVYRTLRHGLSGEDVGFVQRFLGLQGFYSGPVDNSFGPGTRFLNAVKDFQKANGLKVDGVIGPATRAKIMDILLQGKNPQPVKELETRLAKIKALVDEYAAKVKGV
jgi:N-acetylmuramoyl-L-alanine amidase